MHIKAISSLIGTILILVITVAISGTAWSFFSGTLNLGTSVRLIVQPLDCTSNGITIFIKNDGTETANNVTVSRDNNADFCIISSIVAGVEGNCTIPTTGDLGYHSITAKTIGTTSRGTIYCGVSSTPPPLDTIPPLVIITSPINGQTVSGTIIVSASASDDVGVIGVQFKLDGSNLGAEDSNGADGWQTNWITTATSNGLHSLTAVARDAAGNQNTSDLVTVTVDNVLPDLTPPVISIQSPQNITYSVNSVWTNVTLDEPGSVVLRSLDGGLNVSLANSSGNWNGLISGLANGSHDVKFYANDTSGNAASSTVFFTISVDTTPPTIFIQSPANTTYAVNSAWANVTLNEVGSVVLRSLDGGANVSLSNSSGNWNNLMSGLVSGSHNVRFYANDTTGNNAASPTVVFTVDTIAPTCSIASITENTNPLYQHVVGTTIYYSTAVSGSFIVAVSTSDTHSGVQKVAFPATVSAGADDTTSPYDNIYSWSAISIFDSSAVATCYDNANNFNTATFTVSLDTAAPSGGSIIYTDGTYSSASVPITYTFGSDTKSGINSTSGSIERREALLSGGVCGAFGGWSTLVYDSDGSHTDTTVQDQKCYQYQYLIEDNVKNKATYSSANIAKISR